MKQTVLLVAFAISTFLVSLWLLVSGLAHSFSGPLFRFSGSSDAPYILLGPLIGVVVGAPLGYLLRDRVLLRSFLVVLPTPILLALPHLLASHVWWPANLWAPSIGIIGTTAMVLSYCGFSYLAHWASMRFKGGRQIDAIIRKNNMNHYSIFKNSSGAVEAVKEGWSWPAFFFTAFWAIAKKMWLIGIGTIVGLVVVLMIYGAALNAAAGAGLLDRLGLGGIIALVVMPQIAVPLILGTIFGKAGNSWREKNLVSRAYTKLATVKAADSQNAVAQLSKTEKIKR
jgi:hypothetical protein